MIKLRLLISFCLLTATIMSSATESRLFHIERLKNANIVCYDVREENGNLDMDNPIHVYWIRLAEDGSRKELSFIQRTLAFGYKIVSKGQNEVEVKLTAYKGRSIRICQHKGKWVGRVSINGKECTLEHIYVKTKTPDAMRVEYVELFGFNAAGKKVSEKIYNK